MVTKQLTDYISGQRSSGANDAAIRQALLSSGWPEADVNEALGASIPSVPGVASPNTSGQGKMAVIPPEIRGWSWGAFLFTWIWGIGNSVFIAFLMFVPLVNFVMWFILGAKGREWAWQNKKWDSIDHFKSVQKKWAIAGLIFFVISLLISVLMMVAAFNKAKDTVSDLSPFLQKGFEDSFRRSVEEGLRNSR